MMISFKISAIAAFAALASTSNAIQVDIRSETSIRDTASMIAHGLMSYYKNNQSTTPAIEVGTFAMPVYWWQAGAVWGGMVDYYAYTGDASYVEATSNALMANIGPAADFLIPEHKGQEGNDDQAFWALSVMSAAENGFPQPANKPLWGDIAKNTFNNMVPRWDASTCGGGFKWQIYPENNYGYNYKNSISNGGFFQLAARLGRHTGNATYIEWAEKVWNWSVEIGYITSDYQVLDGADDRTGCQRIDHNRWSYNTAIYLYGCASMYAQTGQQKWLDRTNGLLKAAGYYFIQFPGAPNVMTEVVCDKKNSCNADQSSFRAYLARWMAKTAVLIPSTNVHIKDLLEASAKAAAIACSGGSGSACGLKWYINGFDGNTGVGQHLSALEVVQSLLAHKGGYPRKAGDQPAQSPAIQSPIVQPSSTSTVVVPPSSTVQAVPTTASIPTTVAALIIPTSSSSVAEVVPVPSQTSTSIAPVRSSTTTAAILIPSHSPGSFPEMAPSVCSDVIQTVTVTVEPTAILPSSFCTEDFVTVTVTVSPTDTEPVPSIPVVTSSSSIRAKSSSVVTPTTTPVYPFPTGNATATTGTASSGFLTATSPPVFTGAAVPNSHGSTQFVGLMAAVLGMLAAL